LALKGFFAEEELITLNQGNTILPSHVDCNKTPGVDFSTGPLGQGLSMAAGAALGARLQGRNYHTYAILGDGECDEGQVWEGVLFCAQHRITNLIVFVDNNKQQLAGWVDDVCKLGDLPKKFSEFGWFTQKIDGHDVSAIYDAINIAQAERERPSVIILDTIKGKGCKKAEDLELCHHFPFTEQDYAEECKYLDGIIEALTSGRGVRQ
jgi:transketolase